MGRGQKRPGVKAGRTGFLSTTRPMADGKCILITPKDESAKSGSAASRTFSESSHLDGFRIRLRQNSAKLLSILGLWSNGSSWPSLSTDTESQQNNVEQDQSRRSCSLRDGIWKGEDEIPAQTQARKGTAGPKSDARRTVQYASSPCRGVPAPNTARRLSLKWSLFGPSTVIHRTSVKCRPTISNLDGAQSPVSASHGKLCVVDEAAGPQSISPSSSDSPLFSNVSCPSSLDDISANSTASVSVSLSGTKRNWKLPFSEKPGGVRTRSSRSIKTLVEFNPSIVTVEAAANAKIFFETYFDGILSGIDHRASRLQEFKDRLQGLALTEERRLSTLRAWFAYESESLRQFRVLKTRSNRNNHVDTVSIGSYQVVKVLGKGSFGVVQLVKENPSWSNYGTSGRIQRAWEQRNSTATIRKGQKVYAMKVIRKSHMIRMCQEAHIRAERDFLVASEKSQWIVPLVASFQDAHNLYLVMDYMVGGDFFGLLVRKGILPENVAKWYVAEMILCVEEAHRLGWIHRDVKPENFLITESGHLKLADFGLAFDDHWAHNQAYFSNHRYSLLDKLGLKVDGDFKDQTEHIGALCGAPSVPSANAVEPPLEGERILDWRNHIQRRRFARSIVGTSQYMAPEIIRGEPYDGRCDWWSIGIVLYECLYGGTPFYCDNREDTKQCVLNHRFTLAFPTDRNTDKLISMSAIDLIERLLQDKENRLSSRAYQENDRLHFTTVGHRIVVQQMDPSNPNYKGRHVYPDDARDIKAHPFFKDISWNELLHQTPPYLPRVKNPHDTKYFGNADEELADQNVIPSGSSTMVPNTDEARPPQQDGAIPDENMNVSVTAKGSARENQACPPPLPPRNRMPEDKNRPRDKILRDMIVGRTALDLRKKGAFIGYTYRRPIGTRQAAEIIDRHVFS